LKKAYALKLALFFTGISGIVAEFILSTLASYFLGDSILQWTMILSVMLFSMGIGSRLSKYVSKDILLKLIYLEFALSILVSFVPVFIYSVSGYTNFDGPLIYFCSLLIGALIGLEIPLAMRINEEFEPLKVNISSMLEKDYLGSLVGGVFFAFIGLPYLGLVNTSLILGLLNFAVALILFFFLREYLPARKLKIVGVVSVVISVVYVCSFWFVEPIIIFGEQNKYKDTIVYQKQSKYQKIVITQYKSDFWLFINGNLQLSTFDHYLYHEPMVHPAMQVAEATQKVLVIGGGDGFTVTELLKYSSIESIDLVDLDKEMTNVGLAFKGIVAHNGNALSNEKVSIINTDGFSYLKDENNYYDIIIVDLIDAKNIDVNKLYTKEFYQMCYQKLRNNGTLVTQAGNPLLAEKAFYCIDKTMKSSGFNTIGYHNEVNTMGKRGWILGSKETSSAELNEMLISSDFYSIETKWLNSDAMKHMLYFGKPQIDSLDIEINTLNNPVLYHYFLGGKWDMK
jgi:spermidine synthase